MKDESKPMKKITHLKMTLIIFGLFYLIFPQVAFAYLDPGTGSFIIQLLIAGLLAASFTVKLFWGKIKAFCTNLFSKKSRDGEDDE
jgi:hypothetical protein